MENELRQLREKNLKLRLELDVVLLTPNSRRAQKLRDDRLIAIGGIRKPENKHIQDAVIVGNQPVYFR